MGAVLKSIGRISKPGDRLRAKRTLFNATDPAIVRHNQHVGDVLHAYNTAHSAAYSVFFKASYRDSHDAWSSLWHSHATDKGQREFAANYIRDNRLISPTVRKNVLWALAALDELATFRNDVAHSEMLAYYADTLVPGIATKTAAAERLQRLPFDKHWRALKGDLSALANYLDMLAWDVFAENTWPSSKKPRLQLARSTSAKNQERRRQAKKAARERQRQSSPR